MERACRVLLRVIIDDRILAPSGPNGTDRMFRTHVARLSSAALIARKLLPVCRAAIMIADNVGELHKVSVTSHRAVVQVPEAAPKCNRV